MRSGLLAVSAAILVLVGCGGDASTSAPDSPSPATESSPSVPAEMTPPIPSAAPSATPELVTSSPLPVETIDPSASPAESPGIGAAAGCTGNDDNRAFFAGAAETLGWPVYCAALPSGWFVNAGDFTRASGGRLEITYRGPGGATFELHQGAWCGEADGCVPPGTDAGDVAFGDLTGTFVALDDGGWAVVVDRGAELSWLAVGHGMEDLVFLGFATELVNVG
jgi:hypothetical protein